MRDGRGYPGRDSNPHATKAVALKATVSDQFHHPGGSAEGSENARPRTKNSGRVSGATVLQLTLELGVLLGSADTSFGRRTPEMAGAEDID